MKNALSIIIPAYNEEDSIIKVITEVNRKLKTIANTKFQIIVINDGSTDKTARYLNQLLKKKLITKVVTHKNNQGYGAALKSGIKASRYEWIMIIDADQTYPIDEINALVQVKPNFNMVVGARVKKESHIPFSRRLPKTMMLWTARVLSQHNIIDLNSGLRIFDKRLAIEFWHLFPNGFSFTSTITLSSHLRNYSVCYIPISYYKRVGKSSISALDFFRFMLLVVKMVVYFKPLQFFFIPGLTFLTIGFFWTLFTLISRGNVTDSGVLVFVTGLQITLFGLIADLIVKTREHLYNKFE